MDVQTERISISISFVASKLTDVHLKDKVEQKHLVFFFKIFYIILYPDPVLLSDLKQKKTCVSQPSCHTRSTFVESSSDTTLSIRYFPGPVATRLQRWTQQFGEETRQVRRRILWELDPEMG